MNAFTLPSDQFLSLRLSASDSTLMQQLHQRMGLSKSEIVKRALRLLAASTEAQAGVSLYDLGQPSFGRYADATRQSADIKSVVRQRMAAKRQASAL
jgi:Arc/MetJ-type ribon-helix-helix transcriptional regulator